MTVEKAVSALADDLASPHSKPTVTGPLNGPKALFSSAFGRLSGPTCLCRPSRQSQPLSNRAPFFLSPGRNPWAELSMPFAASFFWPLHWGSLRIEAD